MTTKIKKVKVPCPLAGDTHKEKFVERREAIGLNVYRRISELGGAFRAEEEALEELYKILSTLILDWDLEDDTGKALPKPYENPKAFEALADTDADAFIWVLTVVQSPIDQLFEVEEEKS